MSKLARATELALEQRERFDAFRARPENNGDFPTPDGDAIQNFLKDKFEAHQAFLIMDYLVNMYKEDPTSIHDR